ncbi:MAG: Gfo/Idh/MocA family oxidoreductase [Leptospiraceae bacterium]|nr:Gfo/Idh/MocA family oxidoreductase [Leptospiraceae bacterium]
MDSKMVINIAIIGCGRIAGHHIKSIIRDKDFKLIAVCDLIRERADTYANEYNCFSYTNYHKMLKEHPEIDVVAVITPSGMHYEHSKEILELYKKHIIVEKPTFLKWSQVEEVYKLAESLNKKVFSVFQNRYNKAVQRVIQGLKNNELGKLQSIAIRVRWCRPQRYYDLAPWRGTFSQDGGCLTNQGIHHIDLLRYFAGEVQKVSSIHKTLGADIEVEDTATAIIEFKTGVLGTLEITTAARPIDYEASISLVCDKGLAQIGGIAVNELQVYSPDPGACLENSEDFSGSVYGNGHNTIYNNIKSSIQNHSEYEISFSDTLNTIKLLNAFYVSNEIQAWTDVSTSIEPKRLGELNESISRLYRTNN